MHPRNKMRLLSGIPIDPVLESREYQEQEAEKKRKLTEARAVPLRRHELEPKDAKSAQRVVRNVQRAVGHLRSAVKALEQAPAIDFSGDIPHWITEIEELLSTDGGSAGMEPALKALKKEAEKVIAASLKTIDRDTRTELDKKYGKVSEGDDNLMENDLQFFVRDTGDGMFAVMTNKGDTHDVYQNEDEAQEVADKLNLKFARGQAITGRGNGVTEGEQYRVTRTGPAGQNITIAKPGKAEERKVKKFDYDNDGNEESQDTELKGMVKKATQKYVDTNEKLRKKTIKEAWVPADDNTQFELGQRVKLSDAYRGRNGTVIDDSPAPSGGYVTINVEGKGDGYYHKSDVLVRESMHGYTPVAYPVTHEDDDDDPINVVGKEENEDTVFDGTWDKDESPTQLHALDIPSPQDRSGGGDLDREFKVPPKIIASLQTEIDQARKEADVLDTSNKEAAMFYQNLATAFEDIQNHLKKGTVYDFKQAQVFMTSLMGPILHKIPADVFKFMTNGGQQRSLKSYMTDVSKDYPIVGPRNTLDNNDWS